MKADEVKRALEVVVEWGRFGESYNYDYHTGRLTLPEDNQK
ncbi:hypothetical protein [Undibacterium umbellatum]|nr:hypothetical protein [Undibacterium umbellatum]MDP1978071.1 hypothetical protein [Undibacterium sp.]